MPDSLPSNNISGVQGVSEHTQTKIDEPSYSYPWLHSYQEGVPAHLEIPDESLTWLLDRAAKHHPNHAAIIYYGTKISYAQLSNLANHFAISLQRLGIQKGDRVAVALPNIPQFPIAFYGALRAGATVVPTNPLYTEREMQHQLVDAEAKVLVMLDSFYPVVRKIKRATRLEQVIVTSPADFLPQTLRMLYPLSQRHTTSPQPALSKKEFATDTSLHQMRPMLKSHSQGGIELFNLPVAAKSRDLAVLQYTGGTTGLSKGAMLTHGNLLANAYQLYAWMPSTETEREVGLCVAPFFHCYGLTVGMNLSILNASTMILLPRFNAKAVLEAIRRYRPTMFPGIPTMYIAILRQAGKHTEQLQSIKVCMSGASPLPAQVQADFNKATGGGRLVEGYGLSEAAPVTHANPLTDKCRNGSIGLPLPDVEAAILNPATGALLPPGEKGEIVVKGPNIMQGYWHREDETRSMFINGWMRTGDIGYMDEDGYFYIVDRSKDMILASGFNVYPRDVEEILYQHPAVMEVGVVGLPDAYRGETVAAFIVLNKGYEASEKLKEEIIAFCKERLAAYKVPKKLEFRTSLPKSLIGKILRRELRATS